MGVRQPLFFSRAWLGGVWQFGIISCLLCFEGVFSPSGSTRVTSELGGLHLKQRKVTNKM